MKFSTRARYGLRMMVELARGLEKERVVRLGQIAAITNISQNYLLQLTIPLKKRGVIRGISGKNGGYQLARPAGQIKLSEIIEAVDGFISLTGCVRSPDICLNSSFCEARIIWVILSENMFDVLEKFSLRDLIEKQQLAKIREEYSYMSLLYPDQVIREKTLETASACPNMQLPKQKEKDR
ncbi:MAG TPA: Rrf2 family transcriptional regulator [Bacteroidetes bacterium]|nr:Rrf2 family transcriptional regulator [Bacteroidota bacterium]